MQSKMKPEKHSVCYVDCSCVVAPGRIWRRNLQRLSTDTSFRRLDEMPTSPVNYFRGCLDEDYFTALRVLTTGNPVWKTANESIRITALATPSI